MLKVNTNKGKLDIVLNEDSLFKTGPKERVAKTHHFREDGKAKSSSKPQKNNVRDDKLTKSQSIRKDKPPTDASYLTKDQLSRILSSLKSADTEHEPVADLENTYAVTGSMESAAEQIAVHQPSMRDNKTRRKVQKSESKAEDDISDNQEQVITLSKNLQWKKELDEQIALKQELKAKRKLLDKDNEFEEYNPWGRPGGGAPVRTQSGNIVADYKKMHQVKDLTSKDEDSVMSAPEFDSGSKTKTTAHSYNTHDLNTTTTPLAMRSSFAIGAPGVVKYEEYQCKIDEKKKWLQDLEQQIKEKKERQAQEKQQQLQKEAREEKWKQTAVFSNESPPAATAFVVNNTTAATTQQSQIHIEAASPSPLDSSFRAGNHHGRGQGLQSLVEVNQDEMERKRLKTLEHQRAVKEQVEEKRRLKQQEKERRLKDETEKERTLMMERERLKKQYEEELRQREEKENEAKRRAEALELSILQAYETAQQEKAAKRIQQLEMRGHDVSGLKTPGLVLRQRHSSTDTSHLDTASVSPRPEHIRSTPQHKELLAKTNDMLIASTEQENTSFESELKQLSLNASLESEWISSSSVPSVRNNPQAKIQTKKNSPSRAKGAAHVTTRSRSERGQRNKEALKPRNKRQGSVENITGGHEDGAAAAQLARPLEDAFMIPYTRTASATFHPVPNTPSSAQADNVSSRQDQNPMNRNKQTHKKAQSVVTSRTTTTQAVQGRQTVKSEKTGKQFSVTPRSRHEIVQHSTEAGKRDVKGHQTKIQNENASIYPIQASPDRVPTARQEMILQQLAVLRQGLILKERELHHSAI
ncbi:coiled-coil domain-containing protein 66 isoform X4 [Pocillopora verrucosa]|uniref:coiled-coil domain-containing protein 66 isoform X4 n=1 Tax=Pocillopora verrucosa TaxID=203993 RepID=UPI00333F6713